MTILRYVIVAAGEQVVGGGDGGDGGDGSDGGGGGDGGDDGDAGGGVADRRSGGDISSPA